MMLSGIGVQTIRTSFGGPTKKDAPPRRDGPNDDRVVETSHVQSAPVPNKGHVLDTTA